MGELYTLHFKPMNLRSLSRNSVRLREYPVLDITTGLSLKLYDWLRRRLIRRILH